MESSRPAGMGVCGITKRQEEAVSHTITIPNWLPTSDNELGGHWAKARDKKIVDAQMINAYALKYGIPKATGKRIVRIVLVIGKHKRGRLPDPTNFYKSTCDALKACGMLIDDNSTWMEHLPTEVIRGEHTETIIHLHDVPPPAYAIGSITDKYTAKSKRK